MTSELIQTAVADNIEPSQIGAILIGAGAGLVLSAGLTETEVHCLVSEGLAMAQDQDK